MKKTYISPKAKIYNVETAELMAGSDLNRGTEENGVANSRMRSPFDYDEEEW